MLGVGRFVLELFRGNVSPRPARGPSVRGRLHGVRLRAVRPRALRGGYAASAPGGAARRGEGDEKQTRARPGPTTAGIHSAGRDGNDGGAAGSDGAPGPVGPGAAPPNSGAHATIGAPLPAPWAPLDPDTVSHCASSQLSTTLSAPKSRSMSRAHGTPLLAALIGKPHAVLNSSSTRPCGLNSVAIA